MDYISVIGIGVGLAMDAFAVSVTNGALTRNLKFFHAVKIAFFFGVFQFGMPVIGWLIGKAGEGLITNIDHWIAFILLSFIGGKMICDYVKERNNDKVEESRNPITIKTLLALAVATSIDALATGVILPSAVGARTPVLMLIAVTLIGAVTFCISLAGVYIGKAFGYIISKYATLAGGIVLVFIGIKILIEHLFF